MEDGEEEGVWTCLSGDIHRAEGHFEKLPQECVSEELAGNYAIGGRLLVRWHFGKVPYSLSLRQH